MNLVKIKKNNFFLKIFLFFSKYLSNKKKETSENNRILLSNIVLHSCDFSGNVKPFPIARIWSERINKEFTKQVFFFSLKKI